MPNLHNSRVKNPLADANIVSKIFFCWMTSTFRIGARRDLEMSDVHHVLPEEDSALLGNLLQKYWEQELSNSRTKKPSLLRAIRRQFGPAYMGIGVFAFLEECIFLIAQPILLGFLIRYFTGDAGFSLLHGWLFAGGVVSLTVIILLVHHPFFFGVFRSGSQVRIACCALIYRKALRLSQGALSQTTVGQMVNLLSNDVNKFDQCAVHLHYLWITPIQVILISLILWYYFGLYSLYGLAILFLFVPFQAIMGKYFSKMRILTAEKSDTRIRLMNEFLNGIRVIKMYAWEIPFSALVADARKEEMRVIRKTNQLRAINYGIAFIASKIILFVTLLTYVISGQLLNAEKVFVTLTLFNNLRVTVTLYLPQAVSEVAEGLVSVNRLQTFLLLEERPPELVSPEHPFGPKGTIELQSVTAKWTAAQDDPTLTNVNLRVRHGHLVAIIGHVGSGKTSLLQAILKELPPSQGQVKVNGSFGYASQEPWIFGGTVRENILFGKPLNPEWYGRVTEACALSKDFKMLPHGDLTMVADKGSSLSGGQRARVALSRAVYANADIYLLDDPLSAVDTEVGKHIFEQCIMGLLKSKTRILVTHQLQFLTEVKHIILMDHGGTIKLEGSYSDVMKSGVELETLMEIRPVESDHNFARVIPWRRGSMSIEGSTTSIMRYDTSNAFGENPQFGITTHEEIFVLSDLDGPLEVTSGTTVAGFQEESKSSGTVKWALYWQYFRSGSNILVLLILVGTTLIGQFLFTACDYWLNIWSKQEQHGNGTVVEQKLGWTDIPTPSAVIDAVFLGKTRNYYVYVYTGIVGAFAIFSMLRTFMFFSACMDSSVELHKMLFRGIVRTPMRFFETNPLGRVLNRFSKDIGFVDDALPVCFFDALTIFLTVFGVMVLITFVNPYMFGLGLILGALFWAMRNYYMKTARSVKRLEGVVRSPVFTHLSSSLYGLCTIRAYAAETEFIRQFDSYQDLHSSAWFMFIATSRWFGIRLDLISTLFIIMVTLSFMATSEIGSGPEVGLGISSVLVLSGVFQWGVRQSAEVTNQMISVERLVEYASLEPEAALESRPDKKPPSNWPSKGAIEFTDVEVTYGDEESENVLEISSIKINPREKVGIVGRTGAGKSTLLSALFRMVEPAGVIEIDGINILELGLHDVRSRISIIPQEPVLFTGTIRRNLDPFDTFTDAELWTVLSRVHLTNAVKQVQGGLSGLISEGGGNFSLGERQLICLARAILRKNRILVLDEATASVDPETDALIQLTIREIFDDCTVLTIAHRLHTVMDSDRILVLEYGRVKEFDEPYTLLQDESSVLYHLVNETGPASKANLIQIAKAKFEQRRNTLILG